MNKALTTLILASFVVMVLAAGATLTTTAAPQGAATGLNFSSQACQTNGTVSGKLTWTPSNLGEQYVDLAVDSGFGNYSRGGPYAAGVSSVDLTSLASGHTYYARIHTMSGGQTLTSDVLTISATGCGPATPQTFSGTGTLTLSNLHSGKCLEIYGLSQSNFGAAAQWSCWGGPNQTLQAVPQGDGYFELRFAHSNRCLEVMYWDLRNGAPLGQYSCHGGDNQRWSLNASNGGVSVIRNKFSQKCVDVYNWSLRDGDPLVQWDCHHGNNQQWRATTSGRPGPGNGGGGGGGSGPVIAITIDTNGIRAYMPQMLDTLDAYGVKASFGITGPWAVNNPDLMQRMVAAGHTLMNHSWNHPSFPSISSYQRSEELRATDDAIRSVTGVSSKPYFRPPYGATNESVRADAAAAGYRIILWSIDPQGWRGYPAQTIVDHIVARAVNGSVVLMHSTSAGDAAALGPTIAALQARGFHFVTIRELYP